MGTRLYIYIYTEENMKILKYSQGKTDHHLSIKTECGISEWFGKPLCTWLKDKHLCRVSISVNDKTNENVLNSCWIWGVFYQKCKAETAIRHNYRLYMTKVIESLYSMTIIHS